MRPAIFYLFIASLTTLFASCDTDFYIIKKFGIDKNPERIKNGIPILPKEFDNIAVEYDEYYRARLIFCKQKSNKPFKTWLGKEIFLDVHTFQINYERDTYDYRDTVLRIESYWGANKNKSNGSITCDSCEKISNTKAIQIADRWQRSK